jgi:hypothetical protein
LTSLVRQNAIDLRHGGAPSQQHFPRVCGFEARARIVRGDRLERAATSGGGADRRRLYVAIDHCLQPWGSAMNKKVVLLISILLLSSNQTAQAQVTVDVSKITCEQFVLFKIADPKNIAIWLSGYVHGRNNSTIVEPQTFETNMDQLKDYCMTNPKSIVMDGVQQLEKAHK